MNPYKKLYLYFVSHVLKISNKLSIIFQSRNSTTTNFYTTISEAYKSLYSMDMKSGYINGTDIKDIDPVSTVNFLPTKDIYIGVKGASYLYTNETLTKG